MDVRQQPRVQEPSAPSPRVAHDRSSRGFLGNKVLIVALTVLALLAIIGMLLRGYAMVAADKAISSKEYQALFLTNGQVYFGHLSQVNGEYVKLKDIYYLQVQQAVQPKDSSQQAQQQVSLAKLGNELHGPEDQMYVAKNQVLFWENLKNDGKVAQAISDYLKTQKK